MASDLHKPTYEKDSGRGFNPTEVRLYGLPGNTIASKGSKQFDFGMPDFEVAISTKKIGKDSSGKKTLTPWGDKGSLIGISAPSAGHVVWMFAATDTSTGSANEPLDAAIIFGYAFEGHCYDLPKPKVMLIPATPKPLHTSDCGYGDKPEYMVWVVDKLERCIEVEVSQGFIEQLVLSANLPGQRSPSTYRATMAMSHRSGRLTD